MEQASKFARKLNAFLQLSKVEQDCLNAMQSRPRKIQRGHRLTEEGQPESHAFVLLDGWACSYKDLQTAAVRLFLFPLRAISLDCVAFC